MKKYLRSHLLTSKTILFLFLMIGFLGNAQIMQVKIKGGAVVTHGSTITITSGNKIKFEITNIQTGNCKSVNVKSIELSDTVNFSISPSDPDDRSENIKPDDCNGEDELEFEVKTLGTVCGTTTTRVTIKSNFVDFWFDVTVVKTPIISVLGGSPLADIIDGTTTTTATNGTYFGVVEQNLTQTRRFYIANTGSCPLTISSITSSLSNFTIATPVGSIPPASYDIASGASFYFDVTFLAPVIAGTYLSTITVVNNTAGDSNPYTFNVRAEVFNFNIPGPGGITADFRLWLKTTRGITKDGSNKVSLWKDLGSHGKDASQSTSANQPMYLDDVASNINFNPVIKFDNSGVEQFMYNASNGFYTQDIFIVMIPDETISNVTQRRTVFSGISTGVGGDITGVGYGDYSSRYTNEVLSYSQGVNGSYGIAETSTTKTYANAGIINARNNVAETEMDLLYNSKVLTTTTVNPGSFANVGYTDPGPPPTVFGSKYWIGRNFDEQGSLNGRVAEIFTFAERVPDAGRQKIETYLAIKYGITLGATVAEKDYVNSAGTKIWDKTGNAGYNYNIAGIGRDSISDLNQKQSKSLNIANEVTIGLGGIFSKNSANTNEFKKDGDFLVWGCDDGSFTGTSTNTVTIATGITTSLTRIDRKWKIVESKKNVNGDVENIYI